MRARTGCWATSRRYVWLRMPVPWAGRCWLLWPAKDWKGGAREFVEDEDDDMASGGGCDIRERK